MGEDDSLRNISGAGSVHDDSRIFFRWRYGVIVRIAYQFPANVDELIERGENNIVAITISVGGPDLMLEEYNILHTWCVF